MHIFELFQNAEVQKPPEDATPIQILECFGMPLRVKIAMELAVNMLHENPKALFFPAQQGFVIENIQIRDQVSFEVKPVQLPN